MPFFQGGLSRKDQIADPRCFQLRLRLQLCGALPSSLAEEGRCLCGASRLCGCLWVFDFVDRVEPNGKGRICGGLHCAMAMLNRFSGLSGGDRKMLLDRT